MVMVGVAAMASEKVAVMVVLSEALKRYVGEAVWVNDSSVGATLSITMFCSSINEFPKPGTGSSA